MAYGAVTVQDTATLIIGPNVQRRSHFIRNNDGVNAVYIGPDTSITSAELPAVHIPYTGPFQ